MEKRNYKLVSVVANITYSHDVPLIFECINNEGEHQIYLKVSNVMDLEEIIGEKLW